MGREEHCKQISLACVGSARSVWATLGLPHLTGSTLSGSRVLCRHCLKGALHFVHFPGLSHSGSRVLHKGTDLVGHAFCALPRPEQLRQYQALGEHPVPVGPCILITSPVLATQFPRFTWRVPSQVCHVSPLGSPSQAVTLLADVYHPGSQEDVVSNWKPAYSLVEEAGLWGQDCSSPLPSSSDCHTHVSLPPLGEGPVHSRLALLWYSFNPLFCECARLCVRAFHGKVVFFSLSGNLTVWVAISD